jgi:hypothetical protein
MLSRDRREVGFVKLRRRQVVQFVKQVRHPRPGGFFPLQPLHLVVKVAKES